MKKLFSLFVFFALITLGLCAQPTFLGNPQLAGGDGLSYWYDMDENEWVTDRKPQPDQVFTFAVKITDPGLIAFLEETPPEGATNTVGIAMNAYATSFRLRQINAEHIYGMDVVLSQVLNNTALTSVSIILMRAQINGGLWDWQANCDPILLSPSDGTLRAPNTGRGGIEEYPYNNYGVAEPNSVSRIPVSIIDNPEFTVDAQGKLTRYNGSNNNIDIPGDLGIVSIGRNWANMSITAVTIPGTVKEIDEQAFLMCYALTNINIPNSVNVIGEKAFLHTAIASIELPESLAFIGSQAFADCNNLLSAKITAKTIGESAFARCSNLNSVELSANVASFAENAFNESRNIKTLILQWTNPPNYSTSNFGNAFSNKIDIRAATVKIPADTYCNYKTAGWTSYLYNMEYINGGTVADAACAPVDAITGFVDDGLTGIQNPFTAVGYQFDRVSIYEPEKGKFITTVLGYYEADEVATIAIKMGGNDPRVVGRNSDPFFYVYLSDI